MNHRLLNSKLEIRAAQREDTPTVFQMIRALAEFEKLAHEVVTTEELLVKKLFEDAQAPTVLVAFVDKVPVGFALFFRNFSTFLGKPGIYLEDLFVLPNWRSQGIGRELLREVAKYTLSIDGGRLEWSVLNWNQRAISFYESLGARPMSEWTVYRMTGESLRRLAL